MEEEVRIIEGKANDVIRNFVNKNSSLVVLNIDFFGYLSDKICELLKPVIDLDYKISYKYFPVYTVFERIDYLKKFYKNVNTNVNIDDLINKGILDFVGDSYENEPISKRKEYPDTFGCAYFENGVRLIDVSNTGYFQDIIVASHEIGHHMDVISSDGRLKLNNLITESLADTWSLMFRDFYKSEHEEEIHYYNNERLKYFYKEATYISDTIPFLYVYYKYSLINKENYKLCFGMDDDYEKCLLKLKKYDSAKFDTKLQYMLASVLSCYLFYKYKENKEFLDKIKELHYPISIENINKVLKYIDLNPNLKDTADILLESLKRFTEEFTKENERIK